MKIECPVCGEYLEQQPNLTWVCTCGWFRRCVSVVIEDDE